MNDRMLNTSRQLSPRTDKLSNIALIDYSWI
jgi:hypothetical protein